MLICLRQVCCFLSQKRYTEWFEFQIPVRQKWFSRTSRLTSIRSVSCHSPRVAPSANFQNDWFHCDLFNTDQQRVESVRGFLLPVPRRRGRAARRGRCCPAGPRCGRLGPRRRGLPAPRRGAQRRTDAHRAVEGKVQNPKTLPGFGNIHGIYGVRPFAQTMNEPNRQWKFEGAWVISAQSCALREDDVHVAPGKDTWLVRLQTTVILFQGDGER